MILPQREAPVVRSQPSGRRRGPAGERKGGGGDRQGGRTHGSDSRPPPGLPGETGEIGAERPRCVVDAEVEGARGTAVDPGDVADTELGRRVAREHRNGDAGQPEHEQRQHVRQRQQNAGRGDHDGAESEPAPADPVRDPAGQRPDETGEPEQEDEAGDRRRVRERRLLEPIGDVRERPDHREEQRAATDRDTEQPDVREVPRDATAARRQVGLRQAAAHRDRGGERQHREGADGNAPAHESAREGDAEPPDEAARHER